MCTHVCMCVCMCVLTAVPYCADTDILPLESMLLVMDSQCSLTLILELWLYSIWFPRAWVIRSITNLKCHPGSGICCQAVYTFRNTNLPFPSSSLGNNIIFTWLCSIPRTPMTAVRSLRWTVQSTASPSSKKIHRSRRTFFRALFNKNMKL